MILKQRRRRRFAGAVPGQEFVNAFGGVIWQAGQHVGEPSLRIDTVELGCLCRLPNYAERACFPRDSS